MPRDFNLVALVVLDLCDDDGMADDEAVSLLLLNVVVVATVAVVAELRCGTDLIGVHMVRVPMPMPPTPPPLRFDDACCDVLV